MPYPRRVARPKPKTLKQRMSAAAKARSGKRSRLVSSSRSISVSSGIGRNGFSRVVPSGYKAKSRFSRSVQRIIFQTVEKKYRSATINYDAATDLQFTPLPWNHNSLTFINLWSNPSGSITAGTRLFPTQGTTDGNRIGDEIYVSGIAVKLMLNLPSDRRTTSVKVWFSQHNSTQGDPTNKTMFFHGLLNNVMMDKVQTDRWPGLKYLGLFRNSDPDNTTANAHGQIYIKIWIPIKRKVTFITDGDNVTAQGLKEFGTLVFAQYDKIGSLQTDNVINNMQGEATLHYKDP